MLMDFSWVLLLLYSHFRSCLILMCVLFSEFLHCLCPYVKCLVIILYESVIHQVEATSQQDGGVAGRGRL